MKLCLQCCRENDIQVFYPELLAVYDGCDKCNDTNKKSFDIIDVVKHLIVKKGK